MTSRAYSQAMVLPKISGNNADQEETAFFGHPSPAVQKVTLVQRQERERAYKQEVANRMEREKFDDEEINDLVESLKLVSDYLQAILRGEDPDTEPYTDESQPYYRPYPPRKNI